MRPICLPCQKFYRVEKNGFIFAEMIPVDDAKVHWSGYAVWSGDLWKCPGCGHLLISGFGQKPISRHYDEDFVEMMGKVMGHVYG